MAAEKYYLLFSPNFLATFFGWLVVIGLGLVFIRENQVAKAAVEDVYQAIVQRALAWASDLAWWSLVSLMASSCCVLQIILNLFSFGCAGFNTYLGPTRPFFLAVAFVAQVSTWMNIQQSFQYRPAIIATAITCTLTFLPEMLYLYSTLTRRDVKVSSSAAAVAGSSTGRGDIQTIKLKLEGMGCISCVTTIQNALLASPGVVGAQVNFEEGEALVQLHAAGGKEENEDRSTSKSVTVNELCRSLADIGFPASPIATDNQNQPVEKSADAPAARQEFSPSWLSTLVAGLLSSSCCALQLGLNLLSALNVAHVGCAGFNKVLGPWRQVFRTLSIIWLLSLWVRVWQIGTTPEEVDKSKKRPSKLSKKLRNSAFRKVLVATLFTAFLMFLPELLRASGGPAIAPPTENIQSLKFDVDGMGCEACEVAVRQAVQRFDGVVAVDVDFKAGYAEIQVAKEWGNFDMSSVKDELMDLGYIFYDQQQAE